MKTAGAIDIPKWAVEATAGETPLRPVTLAIWILIAAALASLGGLFVADWSPSVIAHVTAEAGTSLPPISMELGKAASATPSIPMMLTALLLGLFGLLIKSN